MFFYDNKYKKIVKRLQLDKPLVIFDVETTGLAIPSDKIVELAFTKIWENGTVKTDDIFFNPEMKISPEAAAVHGITDEFVKDKVKFRDKSQELWEIFANSYYGGFNIKNFDLPILRREFVRVGMDFDYRSDHIIDTREIFSAFVPRSLASAYEYYIGKSLKIGHTAPLNTEVAAEILAKQLDKYQEIRDMEFVRRLHRNGAENFLDIARKFYWRRGETYFAFSKYKDQPLAQVVKEDPDFLNWILNAEFSEETKSIVRTALEKPKTKN